MLNGELVYQDTDTVHEVSDVDVLKNGDDEIVAVQVDGSWYAPDHVKKDDEEDKIVVDGEHQSLTVAEDGIALGGVVVTKSTEAGYLDASSVEVLKNGDGDIVAVDVGGEWYDPNDVKAETTETLAAKSGATALTVADTDGFSALGVATLRVDNPDESSTGGIMTQDDASTAITTIQTAIEKVSAERSKLGAYQNRLEHTIRNLDTSAENLQASESRIRDVDYTEAA